MLHKHDPKVTALREFAQGCNIDGVLTILVSDEEPVRYAMGCRWPNGLRRSVLLQNSAPTQAGFDAAVHELKRWGAD